jgi:hypothetical protein
MSAGSAVKSADENTSEVGRLIFDRDYAVCLLFPEPSD